MDFSCDLERCSKLICFKKIELNPRDYQAHYELADFYMSEQQWVPAIAEYRSSIALGNRGNAVLLSLATAYFKAGSAELSKRTCEILLNAKPEPYLECAVSHLLETLQSEHVERINKLNHNTFYRMKALSDHLTEIFQSSDFSVLDIGGGEGLLSLFLPDVEYMLIEPTINGISVQSPPFDKNKFDCVVACHVLEHIPSDQREEFIDSLCSLARRYVLLLNPFYDENLDQREWQQMIYDITGASWAKEHMDCIMPNVEDIKSYAEKRNYEYRIIPNGSKMMTIAMVFLDHYFCQVPNHGEVEKINEMFNNIKPEKLINEKWPNAYLVEMKLN